MSGVGDDPQAVITASGIWIAQPEGNLRAWIKPKGEPAIIVTETPQEALGRVEDARKRDAFYVIFHEWSYGQAIYFPLHYMNDCSIQVTYKRDGHTTYGGVWAGNCPCEICADGREDQEVPKD